MLAFAGAGHLYAQWVPVSNPSSGEDVRVMMEAGSYLFAGTDGDGIFRSNDGGASWAAVNQGLPANSTVYALADAGDDIYAGMPGAGIFRSNDNGSTWTDANGNLGVNDKNINGITIHDDQVFIATGSSGVFRSSDKGQTWEAVNDGLPVGNFLWTRTITSNDDYLFLLTLGGIVRSNDNGETWEEANDGIVTTINLYNALYATGGDLYLGLGGGNGAFRSSDNGENWVSISAGLENVDDIRAFSSSNGKLYAASSEDGIFLSEDNGDNWDAVNDGLAGDAFEIWSLLALDNDLLAGTKDWIWVRSFDDIVVSNEFDTDTHPKSFSLQQNYPNPFNPTTTFQFNLPERAAVSIKIYDLVGNQVDEMRFGELTAGTYARTWNAEGLASGVYLYRIQAGTFTQTRQLTLIK